jgi:hypothetical protein
MPSFYSHALFESAACFNVLAGFPFLLAMRPAADLVGLGVTKNKTDQSAIPIHC